MVILNNAIKLQSGYLMSLTIDLATEVAKLPTSSAPFDADHFATCTNYGVPVANSHAECKENGKTYIYSDNAWTEAGKKYTITSLSATENKTYTAPTGTAYDSVTVNVPAPVAG